MNWEQVAQQDQALRMSVDNASEALAQFRWEHTLAVGISFREYARQCGVTHTAVRRYAEAYQVMETSGFQVGISDALVRASTSPERADAIQAVAEAKGTSMKNVQLHHQEEVRQVMARSDESSPPSRYLDVVGLLLGARRYLKRALKVDLETDPEMAEALGAYLQKVRDLVSLMELKISDTSDVDWDAELAQLGEDE